MNIKQILLDAVSYHALNEGWIDTPHYYKVISQITFLDYESKPDQETIKTESKEWQPKTGDIVTVWDDDNEYDKRELIYLCTLPNSSTPYCCVSDDYLEHYYSGTIKSVWQFENMSNLGPKKLTLSEIEEKLGYEIEIIKDHEKRTEGIKKHKE